MLDDLVMDALAVDPIANCVRNYFDCLEQKQVAIVPERNPRRKYGYFSLARM